MRIAPDTSLQTVQRNLALLARRLNGLRSSIASGLSLTKPSDDPAGTVRALSLRSSLSVVGTRQGTLTNARRWLAATESAMDSIGSALREIRDIAVEGASTHIVDAQPAALVRRLENIKTWLLEVGNSRLDGRYLFSGTDTLTQPFALSGDPANPVAYCGDGGRQAAPITPATDITLNVPGDFLYNIGGAADPTQPDIFQVIDSLIAHIDSGNSTAASDCIAQLDALHQTFLLARLDIGSRIQRVDAVSTDLLQANVALESALDETEGVDLAAAVTDLQAAEVAYQAALAVAGRLASAPTLFDYL
jgi:flagellar hook-associated protein 3 FlgL